MSIFRFLSFSLVIAAGVATLAAQSSPEQTPAAQSTATAELSSSVTNPFPSLRTERNSLDRILMGDYRPHRSDFSTPRAWLRTNTESQDDGACLKMRVYKLARDGPNSDSMHPAGYSTCVPAARFKAYSIVLTTP